MTNERLNQLLERFANLRIAVVGDFFLAKYLITDPSLAETSIETGLEARQVVEIRCSPGAAGTVTNNLSALGVDEMWSVSVLGEDGEGFELTRALSTSRVRCDGVLRSPDRFTPTYTKPMSRLPDGERELERLDIKNRQELSESHAEYVCRILESLAAEQAVDAIIIADQVQERNCGVITDRVRDQVGSLAPQHPEILFFADSRVRIGEFRNVIIKPNRQEAARALYPDWTGDVTLGQAKDIGHELAVRNGNTVYVTVGEDGILVCEPGAVERVPTPPVDGPIDIVGAGDSTTAGIVCALCAGATTVEAALIGDLCAAITIRKLGTTGTASQLELREMLRSVINGDKA